MYAPTGLLCIQYPLPSNLLFCQAAGDTPLTSTFHPKKPQREKREKDHYYQFLFYLIHIYFQIIPLQED
jgi:hypothetical protein